MSHEIREKCDVFRHYMFVCYRAFLHDRQQLRPVTFYNIVTKKHILTVSSCLVFIYIYIYI
jgi:Mg2+ and Co2+ transporter CorA